MDEVRFLEVNMRKALTKAYCMDYDIFVDVIYDRLSSDLTYAKWEMIQQNFTHWYMSLTSAQASKFCYWVLYSEYEIL